MTRLERRPCPAVKITDPLGEPGGLGEQGAGRGVIILPESQQAQRVERLGSDRQAGRRLRVGKEPFQMPAALPEVTAGVPQVIEVARQLQCVRDVRRTASFKRGGQIVELCLGQVQRGQPLIVRVAQPGHLRPDPAAPRQVPETEPLTLVVQVQLRGGELAQRFQHEVPQTGSGLGSHHQRLVDQCG